VRFGDLLTLTLLRSVSVNLAELRRAPGAGGGVPRLRDALTRGCLIFDAEFLIICSWKLR
jgi:hypothetical protein